MNDNVKGQRRLPFFVANLLVAGEQEGVEIDGTFWLIGQMVEARVIVARQADAAYRKMREAGRRRPWEEIEQQLRAFGK